ncbi:Nucleolar complex protein 4 [Spathaspora sp. JA1]|nr:Nucleolar complex protein 4 [Spathaspora sp. JA1]
MAPKRKAASSAGGSKKSKKAGSEQTKSVLLSVEQIRALGDEIITSTKVNNLVILLEQFNQVQEMLISQQDTEVETVGRKLSVVLFTSFSKLLKDGQMIPKKSYDDKKKMVVNWILDKYTNFKNIMCQYIINQMSFETSVQLDVLEIYLNLIKLESQYMKSNVADVYFPNITYKQLVESILLSANQFVVLEFAETFKTNWDLQFYLFNIINEVLQEWKTTRTEQELQTIVNNFHSLIANGLLLSDNLEEQPSWIGKIPSIAYKPTTFKNQYQKFIITLLSYPLTTSQYKSILVILHKRIIPYMAQPQGLMDFLTDSYDVSDDLIVPILALNSLYELMKQYNLEYPDFYTKLYSLLTPKLLYTRYRSRFFRLCDLFLSSTHLSGNLVASFIKKLARLSITSSASGVVIIIPFIYNLLKRHPTCMIMLHNPEVTPGYTDPFDNQEKNPMNTQAIGSSLWELETLMSHYHPNIATLAKIFAEPFRKHSYNMEDFLDWSYISLLQSESTRRYKTLAALEFEEFDMLFEQQEESNKRVLLPGWTI